MKIGLVLSGGGARGAYEVGVLQYVKETLPREIAAEVRFDIYCGTSVGAINACYLASTASDPNEGVKTLRQVWESMEFDDVVRFGARQLAAAPALFLGSLPFTTERKGRLGGLLNTLPLEELVIDRIDWGGIHRGIASGAFESLAVSTTDVLSGQTTVFVEQRGGGAPTLSSDSHALARPAILRAEHALASAAIPFLFPAVSIDGRFYSDGGVRQNTPISPALRLGADKLLVIGLRHVSQPRTDGSIDAVKPTPQPPPMEEALHHKRLAQFPGLPFLAGKVLNALLLDHLDYDIDRLHRFNAMLEGGARVYGPDFAEKINAVLEPMRKASYRQVDAVVVKPSLDLGHIAAEHARRGPFSRKAKGLFARICSSTAPIAGISWRSAIKTPRRKARKSPRSSNHERPRLPRASACAWRRRITARTPRRRAVGHGARVARVHARACAHGVCV
jgi:NTE family protein